MYRYFEEQGGREYFNMYDPEHNPSKAEELGNLNPGDGYRYRGRGMLHLTGRYNYEQFSRHMNLNFIEQPDLIETPAGAVLSSIWFWQERVQPRVRDFSDVRAVTRPINPGLNGIESRQRLFQRYMFHFERLGLLD
jgi:putative chitinase